MKKKLILFSSFLITGCLLLSSFSPSVSAAPFTQIRGGQSCRKIGEVSGTITTSFVCRKVGRKLVWRKVVVSPTATIAIVPTTTMSTQVLDLNGFIGTHAKSVVTVSCGNSQGSGVSIPFSKDSGLVAGRGFQSMVITNEHVIYGCLTEANLYNSEVVVNVKYGGVEYVGYALVYPSWEQVNAGLKPDLAAVFTTGMIPQSSVFGVKQPALGHAVVAVGSAGGVPNVTTRGEIAGATPTKIITVKYNDKTIESYGN